MKKNNKEIIIKLLFAALLVTGAWCVVESHCVSLKFLAPSVLRDFIRSFGRLSALAYIIAYAFNTISIIPPIAILSLTAGFIFGPVWGGFYLMAGALIGTTVTFLISRYLGRNLAEKMLKGKFRDFDQKLAENGFMAILFFRAVPLLPYEFLNYAAGLSRIKFRDYFLATFLGLIPGVVVAAFFGGSLGEIKSFKDIFAPKLIIAVALIIIIIAIPAIYKMRVKK